MAHFAMKIAAAVLLFTSVANASNDAEEARWLVQTSLWGTLSWLEGGSVSSKVTAYGESDGRVFYYLQGINMEFKGSLTLSEAAVDSNQFDGARCGPSADLDPEDPRCAKLTLSGTMAPCGDDTRQFGLDTLFATHPQMANWPQEHGFTIFEMTIDTLWMIASYGGGSTTSIADFLAAEPIHHPVHAFRTRRIAEVKTAKVNTRPNFGDDVAGHARWLVAKSLWTTISTISSREEGQAFGNIRSMADGECFLGGSGSPYFYLPTPDPTAIDVEADNQIVLSFTEAALPHLVGEDGMACNGMDAEDPTCARISLMGHAIPLDDNQIEKAKESFGVQHPRADWLSKGGAHTGGNYYTIDIYGMQFFRSYGGVAKLTVDEYTNWKPDPSKFDGEDQCDMAGTDEPKEYSHSSSEHPHDMHSGHDEHSSYEHVHEDHHEGSYDDNHSSYERSHEIESDTSLVEKGDNFSINSFLFGTIFGFLFWGPTIAFVAYHKLCGSRNPSFTNLSGEYEPALIKSAPIV